MPFIDSDGVAIHYRVEGAADKPALLLHHGWSSDLEAWRDFGYIGALEERFRLVSMDARGHGRSAAPMARDAYASGAFVRDVSAVLDAAGVGRTHFWGYSMGAAIGFQLAIDAPDRVESLILGGMHPYSSSERSGWSVSMVRLLREQGMAGFVAEREHGLNGRLASKMRERLLAMNPAGLALALETWTGWRGVGDRLGDLPAGAVLYAGDLDRPFHDAARRAAREMPDAHFISLPGRSHDGAFASSRAVIEAINPFLPPSSPA